MRGHGSVPDVYIVAEICEKYGWTWDEYHSQPIEFIANIQEKMRVEAEAQRDKTKNY